MQGVERLCALPASKPFDRLGEGLIYLDHRGRARLGLDEVDLVANNILLLERQHMARALECQVAETTGPRLLLFKLGGDRGVALLGQIRTAAFWLDTRK